MLTLAPLDIGPAAGEEDLDLKVLKVSFQIMRILYSLLEYVISIQL